MQLSVIILNYKVPYHLLLCLQSVQEALQKIEAEIIVVDNHSEDESCELVQQYFPEVILIQNKQNEGFSKGNNRGVKIAKGKTICLLNPDTVVSETVFEYVLKFAETNPGFGAIGVKMIDGTGNFLPESKRNLPAPRVAFQKLLGNAENYYASHLNANETGKIEILPGAFMFMKKSRYEEVGGLDEAYFMYGEDIDLSYKFSKAGYQNYYLGSETILHFKGESTVKDKEYAKRFYGAMQIFYKKHFRSNFAMDVAVKIALALAQAKSVRLEKKPSVVLEEKNYWVSQKEIPEGLKGLPLEKISLKNLKTHKFSSVKFIFDVESIFFSEILDAMQNQKNHGNRFRIFSTKQHFMLGGDSSTMKGEVSLIG